MVKQSSIAELRKMQKKDLQGEIRTQDRLVSKLGLGVKLLKEKDTAKYTSEKKQLARMRTVLTEKETEELLVQSTESKVVAPAEAEAEKSTSQSKKS